VNNIEHRIEKLEKHTGVGIQEDVSLVVVTGGLDKQQVDAKVEKAIAEYKAIHPECSVRRFLILQVMNEHTKELTENVSRRLLEGERLGRIPSDGEDVR